MQLEKKFLKEFDKYVKVKAYRRSISSIVDVSNPFISYNYNLAFQRKSVWNDKEKCPYFLESQLLGYETGTLIMVEDINGYDTIDGRQRIETVLKFYNNELPLDKNGLTILKAFHGLYYKDLPEDIKKAFLNSKLRVYEFSFIENNKLSYEEKDYIKRYIFRIYNMNTVALKNIEIDRAKYFNHQMTQNIKKKFLSDEKVYDNFIKLFLSKRYLGIKDIDNTERILKEIRQLTVINEIPVKYYAAKGIKIVDKYYKFICENNIDINSFYKNILDKMEIINAYNNYIEKVNGKPLILLNEVLYKVLDIFDKENIPKEKYLNEEIISDFGKYIIKNKEYFEIKKVCFYKKVLSRYQLCFDFFQKKFDINFDLYFDSGKDSDGKINSEEQTEQDTNKLINLIETRINKSSPADEPIYSIVNDMKNNRFLIRPAYQRSEVVDYRIASSIIESIMLGIPLPPFYFFVKNHVHECVDGQQRLLSILGFLGEYYRNEKGEIEYSRKNGFRLTELSVLKEEEGKTFSELSPEYQRKILSASLSIVEIDYQMYPEFDKVEQFVRLNSKSYIIRKNSFEMWNAILSEKITNKIKSIVNKYSKWFYIKCPARDTRMKNEEFFTTLMVFDYFYTHGFGKDFLKVYAKDNMIIIKIADKKAISDFIDKSEGNRNEIAILKSIDNVENYIKKLKKLLSEDKKCDNDTLNKELNKLISPSAKHGRTLTVSYLLWQLLNPVPEETVKENREFIKKHIHNIILLTKNPKNVSNEELNKSFKITMKVYEKKFNKKTSIKTSKNYINKITGKQELEKIILNPSSEKIVKNITLPDKQKNEGKNINLNMPVVLNLINNS